MMPPVPASGRGAAEMPVTARRRDLPWPDLFFDIVQLG